MTSANVSNYIIRHKEKIVGKHSQHHMCHTRWHRLYKYTPFTEHTIQRTWDDEDEVTHEYDEASLVEFLAEHPPRIADMKRMIAYAEKQNTILKEWVDKFGTQDKELSLRTRNSISHSPL